MIKPAPSVAADCIVAIGEYLRSCQENNLPDGSDPSDPDAVNEFLGTSVALMTTRGSPTTGI